MALFTGCVAAWELDDLTDATGRGNTLTNNNSATFNTGKIGNAVYVASASSQYLSKASSADVEMGDIDFTIGCWAYATSLGATAKHIILGKDASGQREYYLHAEDQGGGSSNYRYSFAVFSGGVEKTVIANTFGNIVTGVWNCIIVWWNASTQTLSISINDGGVDNFSVGADLGAVGTAQFRIGARQFSGFENYWNGRIDAVHLWKRVLSPTERSEFYNSGNGIEFGGTLAPTARAGLDQVRMELETVMLDSSQSTSGVGIASRLWEQVSGTAVEILNATSVNPTFVAPDVAVDTNLVFKVTITDTESNTAEDQVTITIVPTGSTTWLWNVPQEQGLDPDEFYSSLLFLPDKSMVIRNGRVIGTRGDVTTEGLTWSASKSLVALIFARQLQLANVAYTDTVPLTGSPLATFEQMMAMVGDYNLTPHSPGDHYAYNNLGVHHYGTHLKDTFYAGNTHVQALQNAFVTALDFEDTLGYNTSGLMSGWDGGWSMSTRDLARICQLILQNGLWEGTQILDSDFIDRLYTCQVPDAATQSTDEGDIQTNELVLTVHLHGAYSFGFWLAQNHDFIGPPTMNEAISMIGAYGTTAHISRAKQLIVVACNVGGTTTNDSTVAIPGSVFDLFANAIPEQRASSRLFRASLHAFFDDEELNRTEFLVPTAVDHQLVIQDSSHAHTAANLALTQTHVLTIQDASHAHTTQNVVLFFSPRASSRLHRGSLFNFFDDEDLNRTEFWEVSTEVTLTIQDVSHLHAADNLILTQAHLLAVQDSTHGHAVESVVLTQAHALTIQDSNHAQVSESPSLTQVHSLTVNGAVHSHAADNITLLQDHQLGVQSAAHAHAADSLVLAQDHVLIVDSATHAHAAESVVLSIEGDLAIADGLHGHTGENLVLTQLHLLSVASAVHSHAAEDLTLSQVHELALDNAIHGHTSDGLLLTQAHSLEVQNAAHSHAADNVVLATEGMLVIADASHAHVVEQLVLSQVHTLSVESAVHAHLADSLVLEVQGTLSVQDAVHAHTTEAVSLAQGHVLAVDNSLHAHNSDNAAITAGSSLEIQDCQHSQAAESLILTQAHALIVAGSIHAHVADNLSLTEVYSLTIQSAVHSHTVEAPALGQVHGLAVQNATHAHIAANVTLGTQGFLLINDSFHTHTARNVSFQWTMPADVFAVATEGRTFIVETENRVFVVAGEERIFTV